MSGTSADDPAKVDAEPTKEFFVSMLVRDIELIPALVNLVDNSVERSTAAARIEQIRRAFRSNRCNIRHVPHRR